MNEAETAKDNAAAIKLLKDAAFDAVDLAFQTAQTAKKNDAQTKQTALTKQNKLLLQLRGLRLTIGYQKSTLLTKVRHKRLMQLPLHKLRLMNVQLQSTLHWQQHQPQLQIL